MPIFQELSTEEIEAISSRIFCKQHPKGHLFYHQHDLAERMYIIEKGEVALIEPKKREPKLIREGAAFGSMAFLTGASDATTAVATADTTVWVLRKHDFNDLLQKFPSLEQAVRQFLQQPEVSIYLQQRQNFDPGKAARWTRKVLKTMDVAKLLPSTAEMIETIQEHRQAPLAIWLGLMLDDIPESLVLGSSLVHSHVSLSLIAGLFLSNYPEALSSSIGMRQQGLSWRRVLLMWTSVMAVAGIGAAVGSLFLVGVSPVLFFFLQGLAVGAILTVIAETILPEAYFKGSSITGFSTLLGFLAAIFLKTLE